MDELTNEDFSGFTAGTADKPDGTSLCDIYGKYGPQREEIDSKYTSTPGWHGNWVFQAGGNAALIDSLGSVGAFINTPLGDYSGDLTITVRVKGLEKDPSSFFVNVVKGGYYDPYTLGGWNFSVTNKGWQVFEIKFHNVVADNDGFVQLVTYGKCIVDYFYVTNTYNFLAAPKVLAPTNFTTDGFTANWQPVRRAGSYDMWLYKMVNTSDKDTSIDENFENGKPAEWEFGGNASIAEGLGEGGSKAVVLNNGDTISSPFTLGLYRNLSTWMKVVSNGATSDELNNGRIELWLRTIGGWKKLGEMNAAGWLEGGIMDMQQKTGNAFANQFYGVRVVANLPGKASLVIDNVKAQIGPSAKLETVGEYEAAGLRYDNTGETSYTFKGLDPLGDYYYGVKSYYFGKTSDMTLNHAFGVAKPVVNVATGITADGFTATWNATPKATSYQIDNYGVFSVSKAGRYAIEDESFSKIDESITISSNPYKAETLNNNYSMSLDEYTSNIGWRGRYTAISSDCLGFTGSGSLTTPVLDLKNSDKFYITLKGYGTPGDVLKIENGENVYNIDVVADPSDETGTHGIIDGTFTVPDSGEGISLKFYSAAGATIMFDKIKVSQDLKEGDKAYVLVSSDTTSKDELSHTYSGLSQSDYNEFVYKVYAKYEYVDGHTAVSDPSDLVHVNLESGNSNFLTATVVPTDINDVMSGDDVRVIGYYTVDGRRLQSPVKGLNIVRYSNGTQKKVLVK